MWNDGHFLTINKFFRRASIKYDINGLLNLVKS